MRPDQKQHTPSEPASSSSSQQHTDSTPALAGETDQQSVAQNIVARQRYPHWRIVHRAQVLAVVYALALVAVILLALAAHSTRFLPGDVLFTLEVQMLPNPMIFGTPVVFDLMYGVSLFGYTIASTTILIGVVSILWLLNLRLEALFVVLTIPADVIGSIIKLVVGRPRPSPDLVHVVDRLNSYSFPSGHVLHYTVFYGFLLFALAINFRPSWGRNTLMVICVLLIALIGVSRVYLGEHWASDVLGGYLIGALYLIPLLIAYVWARTRFVTHSAHSTHTQPQDESPTNNEVNPSPNQPALPTPNR